ncbi:hypothetical protein CRG86_007460 [Photobacterium leiognathi]|nr:hypothetical protein CRG86_007460 [Photobacterium leiognathi]
MISKRSLEPIETLDDAGIEIDFNNNVNTHIIPLRLTQTGHDFAKSLISNEVFEQLKENFSDKPFEIIFNTGQALLEHLAKKKLDQILSL